MVEFNSKHSIIRIPSRLLSISAGLPFLIRLVLGMVFIYAGTVKLLDPKAFARIISQYDLIPRAAFTRRGYRVTGPGTFGRDRGDPVGAGKFKRHAFHFAGTLCIRALVWDFEGLRGGLRLFFPGGIKRPGRSLAGLLSGPDDDGRGHFCIRFKVA